MLKTLLESYPSIRQAMLLGHEGPLEVATSDDAVTPTQAFVQHREFVALGHKLALGELLSAAAADREVSLSFHRAEDAVLAVVTVSRENALGEHLADLDAHADWLSASTAASPKARR